MFRTPAISVVLILLFLSPAFSQATKEDLTNQAYTLYQQGKFEKAVESAKKVVKLEKFSQSKDSVSYVNALINLARINQGYFIDLQNKAVDKSIIGREKIELYKKISQIAGETEKLLREIIQINESDGRAQTTQTADVKIELASLVQKYNPTTVPSVESSRGRIDEAEKLLAQSLLTNEQIRGKDDDKTLAVVLQSGDFYYKYVNFEKALPFYERYIETTEKTHGKNYPELADALRAYSSIMFTTFQDRKAADALEKIERITQKKEETKADKYLNLRSKDAVAFSVHVSQSLNSNRNLSITSGTNLTSRPKIIRVPVKVVIDENGKVIEAIAESDDEKLRARAEQEVVKWSVRPFSYQGNTQKMRGYLTYLEVK